MEKDFLNVMEKIYNQVEAVYSVNESTNTYRAIKTDGVFRDMFGTQGTYEKMLEIFTNYSKNRAVATDEKYEVFYRMSVFQGKVFRRIHLVIDGQSVLVGINCYPVGEKESILFFNILDDEVDNYGQYSSEKEKIMESVYLYAMSVDLDKGCCSNISMSEIENAEQSFGELAQSYERWRNVIVDMFHPDYKEIFMEYSSEKVLREYLTKHRTRTLDCQMINLEGNMIWVKLIWNRIKTKDEDDFCFVYLVENINDSHTELMNELSKYEEMAKKDSLTQLLNRWSMQQILMAAMGYKRNSNKPVSLIMYDVDHFKQVNDIYGHAVGDEVLVSFAQIATAFLDQYDCSVGRWGGEEFVVVLKGTEKEQACKIADELRMLMEEHVFQQGFHVTSSFGVVEMRDNEKAEDAFMRVDAALYKAKEEGRNRVVCG